MWRAHGGAAFTPPGVTAHVCRLQIRGSPLCCCQLNLRGGRRRDSERGRKFRGFQGFLSVGGRDLVLDLTDLLFQAEAPLLCGILIPDYITFHLAIRQTTATPPSVQVSCCGHVRQTVHMNTQTWKHVSVMGSYSETFCTLSLVLLLLVLLLCSGF